MNTTPTPHQYNTRITLAINYSTLEPLAFPHFIRQHNTQQVYSKQRIITNNSKAFLNSTLNSLLNLNYEFKSFGL